MIQTETTATRTARNLQNACVRFGDLITVASVELLDGNTTKALIALNEVRQLNLELAHVYSLIADGKLAEAELISERAVAERKQA